MAKISKSPKIVAWALFVGSLIVLLICDGALRIKRGSIHEPGLPEMIYHGFPIVAAIVSMTIYWKGTRTQTNLTRRITETAVNVLSGAVIYFVVTFYYVVGTGIDSL